MLCLDVTRDTATLNFSCEKLWVITLIPATFKIWPCALLKVIPNAGFIGNWSLLNWQSNSEGIFGVLNIKTVSPGPQSVNIMRPIKKIAYLSLL